MKTPIQELIEKVNQWMLDDTEVLKNPLDYEEYMVMHANQMVKIKGEFIDMCKSLLEKEEKLVMDSYDQGRKDSADKVLVDELKYTSRDYYNENFI